MQISSHFLPCHRLSRHAMIRMQQRSIPSFIIDLLLELTDSVSAGGGSFKHGFHVDSWAEAQRTLGSRASKLDRYRNAYVIVAADGTVATAARQH